MEIKAGDIYSSGTAAASKRSRRQELMTSVIASGVLCAISDGVLFDDQFTVANSAIAWARDGERSILSELDK
jgi:hypothetical protein